MIVSDIKIIDQLMISSSNFFKKTLFTIDAEERKKKNRKEPLGPWQQQKSEYTYSNDKSKKRYMSIDHPLKKLPNHSNHSNLFSERRSLSLRKEEVKKEQNPPLKFPKINEYDLTNKIKYCLNLESLNFIKKNNTNTFKKMVLKPNYDFIKPRNEIYRNFIMEERNRISDCKNPNDFFYHG